MIMFTSGTTGRSKGVMLNQWSIMVTGRDSICSWPPMVERARAMGIPDEKFQLNHFSTLPLFHIAAYANLLHWPLYGTATNLADARSFYRDLADMPSESMAVVPAIAEMLHRDILRDRRDKIGACICCEPADEEAVRDHITRLNRTLPLYKRIAAVEFSAEPLPRTAVGKLQRK